MANASQESRFRHLLSEIFGELSGSVEIIEPISPTTSADVEVILSDTGKGYLFDVKARERVTPQIADELFQRIASERISSEAIRVVFAPVISDRVAQMARARGVSYLDYAGNCYIVDRKRGLLISRSGIKNDAVTRKQAVINVFSTKSSRIVRAMLHKPTYSWQVSELAKKAEVSIGLVSKVKEGLIYENYAEVLMDLLRLKNPAELLEDWTHNYPGPASERQFYARGEVAEIEKKVTAWCLKTGNEHALARFSAAWRLAPEVRYTMASLYLGKLLDRPAEFTSFCEDCGLKEVDSGGNLAVLVPFDESVFVDCASMPERTTSALQTYLDLKRMPGRAGDAAVSVYEKHLRQQLENTEDTE